MEKNFEEALREYHEALKIRIAELGEFDPSVADTRNNLGLLYARQKLLPEARQQFEEALRIRRTHFGEAHELVSETRANLVQLAVPSRKKNPVCCVLGMSQ